MQQTLTGLRRWSSISGDLPAIPSIKALHVYDFDNTLFKSPLPNHKLWTSASLSRLQNQDAFKGGGWWHDAGILEATGRGLEIEEPRAWQGWWNETIVELARLSLRQPDALTVLLTGRSEPKFAALIARMAAAKHLSFDMVCLKPEVGPQNQRFSSTMLFKQAVLRDLMETYHLATEIKVYEDRPKQTTGFREYFAGYNQAKLATGGVPIRADVVQVTEQATTLDPVIETAEVQRMINSSRDADSPRMANLKLQRLTQYTGYMITPTDTARLLELVRIPPTTAEGDVKLMATNITISSGSASTSTLDKVGGIGSKMAWQVVGLAYYQCAIWAAKVAPIPPSAPVQTFYQEPLIVLACSRDARLELVREIRVWQPVPAAKRYILQTTVGEKLSLHIDSEADKGHQNRSGHKRRHDGENITPNKSTFRPDQRSRTTNANNRAFHGATRGPRIVSYPSSRQIRA